MPFWGFLPGDVWAARERLADAVLEHLQQMVEEQQERELAEGQPPTTQGA